MNEEHIIKVKYDPDNPPHGDTDWDSLDKMSEEEIITRALSDPDNLPLTDKELKQFHRVWEAKEAA